MDGDTLTEQLGDVVDQMADPKATRPDKKTLITEVEKKAAWENVKSLFPPGTPRGDVLKKVVVEKLADKRAKDRLVDK
ncbi:MAG: hypothetical protein AAB909_00040 [Patescibacteria group bacterium]